MKVSLIALVLAVAFAAQPSFAATSTIGDLVSDGLCPDAITRLQQNTLLNTALTLAASTPIDLPETGTPILFAPSDAALTAALPKLGLSVAQLAAKPELIKNILDLHIASATGPDSMTATTLADTEAEFMTNAGQGVPLSQFITGNAADLSVMEGPNMAGVEDIVACPGGPVAVFTDLVFLPGAPSPAGAPTPGPAPAPPTTIGGLIGYGCQDIKDIRDGPEFLKFSTLFGLLQDPEIAATKINLPNGVFVLAAPTNDAFATYLGGISPLVASNKTALAAVLANHIAVATAASDTSAKALSGETMDFSTAMDAATAPTATSIAAIAAAESGMITSEPSGAMANVVGAVACATEGHYVFGVDTVLPPAGFMPAPAPGPAPTPTPTPVPVPPPSSAGVASMGLAALASIAAALFA